MKDDYQEEMLPDIRGAKGEKNVFEEKYIL